MKKARVLSFEGLDNCGKTTQIELSRAYLEQKGIALTVEREPGATALGNTLRMILAHPNMAYANHNIGMREEDGFQQVDIHQPRSALSELALFLAARAEFVDKIIAPAIKEERSVLADRHLDSSVAYQGWGLFEGDPGMLGWIDHTHNVIFSGREHLRPTKTFLLDIPYETMMQRAGQKADAIESRGRDFFERVRRGYLAIAKNDPMRVIEFDGTQPVQRIFEEGIKPYLNILYGL